MTTLYAIFLLPLNTNVITTDISDHDIIALQLPKSYITCSVKKRNFCQQNKEKFTMKLINANWAHLYTFGDADQAFNYFIRKLKRICNKSFPFVMITNKNTTKPWLTRGILKSIKTKNKLYLQAKRNAIYKSKYVQYRNKLTTILRKAKQHYYINTLNDVKNNSKKLWTHLNFIIKPNSINNCPVDCEKLNEFFLMFLNIKKSSDST